MHKALWFFSGIVVAVALAAAWMFLISPHGGHHREARMDEPLTRAAVLEKQRERFGSFDTNADGTLTLAEWEAFHAARFDAQDANKDGTLTMDEMRAARQEKKPGSDD